MMSESELRKVVTGFRRGIVGKKAGQGYCFMVSSALAGYLSFAGVPCQVTKGMVKHTIAGKVCHGVPARSEHYWVTLKDGRIVDATADQFGLPPVYIGALPKSYKEEPCLT